MNVNSSNADTKKIMIQSRHLSIFYYTVIPLTSQPLTWKTNTTKEVIKWIYYDYKIEKL